MVIITGADVIIEEAFQTDESCECKKEMSHAVGCFHISG
jgi:hypothetical protein